MAARSVGRIAFASSLGNVGKAGRSCCFTIDTTSPPSELVTSGSCPPAVVAITSSRTLPSAMRRSSPGARRCLTNAAVNGLFGPCRPRRQRWAWWRRRSACWWRRARRGRPRPTERVATVRFMDLRNGFSRQASSSTSRRRRAGSIACTRSTSRTRPVLDVEIGGEAYIDGDQVVGLAHLDAVPGVVKHRHVGIGGLAGERLERPAQVGHAGVVHDIDGFEARGLEQRCDNDRIVRNIGEARIRAYAQFPTISATRFSACAEAQPTTTQNNASHQPYDNSQSAPHHQIVLSAPFPPDA